MAEDEAPYAWIPDKDILQSAASSPIESLLGCAAWGCSFLLENGRAFKVTSDDDEVKAIDFFLKARQEGESFSGIVDIFTSPEVVAEFPWKDRTRTQIYAYEREIVEPLMHPDEPRFDLGLLKHSRNAAEESRRDAIWILNDIGVDIAQNRTNPFLKRTKPQRRKIELRLVDEYDHWLAVLTEDIEGSKVKADLSPIVESLQAVNQKGMILHDIGPSNMGYTASGVLKLYDFELIET